MKKLKLVMSIATMCLAIAVLCFGVLAATSVTYTIQGTISYDVEDVYVDVNTTVYKSAKYLSVTEQNTLLESLGNPANLSSAKTTYELVETGNNNSFSTLNTESPELFDGLALTFNKDVKTYAIVVNVKNLTDENAWAVVDSRTSTSTNVTIVDNYQLEISKTADTNGKNVVIVVTPKDLTQPIDSGTFTFNLVFGSGEYVNSKTNTDKMIITDNSDGTKSVKKASDDISGVLAIPSSVTSIGGSAFYGCGSLTSIEIPSSVTGIISYAFAYCEELTSITIPSSVTSVGYQAFSSCSSLTSITIPSSVTFITIYEFFRCSSLESITVSGTGGTYTAKNNCLIKGTELVLGCKTSVIPSDGSVTSIGSRAFAFCSSLTSITIPNSVTSIGEYAFMDCSSLTSIEIPNSVTSIGSSAFNGCSRLTTINFTGTQAQWNAISKSSANIKAGVKVVCTDGEIVIK